MRINISEVIQLLQKGEVVALPTETVYGLAASIHHTPAIEKIYKLKGRPSSNPLIIHVHSIEQILEYISTIPPGFHELAKRFWPGPLTLIMPVKENLIDPLIRAGLQTAGFRIPSHPETLNILKSTGPLVMPSANLSGKPSATQPEHVENDFGPAFPVLDSNSIMKGVESTILGFKDNKWLILRLGALEPEAFKQVLGYEPVFTEIISSKPICPGQLFRHYAPNAQLFFNHSTKVQAIIGFKERNYSKDKKIFILGSLSNPQSVAENLYHILRQLDKEDIQSAWVDMEFPNNGLWITIRERIQKAAQKKLS